MKRENEERGCFLQCDHTGEKQKSKNKKTGLNSQKQGSTLKKSQGKEKMQFCGNLGSAENTTNRLIFWKKKNLNLTPAFSFPKKKKFENEKS